MKRINEFGRQLINANDELLVVEDVAAMLHIKPASVRKRIQRGTLTAYKPRGSKRLMFSRVEVLKELKQTNL